MNKPTLVWQRIVLFAAVLLWAASPATAPSAIAAEAKPTAYQCAVAYSAAGKERGRFQLAKVKGEKGAHSFAEHVPNAELLQAYQYNERAGKLSGRIDKEASSQPSAFNYNGLSASMDGTKIADEMASESFFAASNARLDPKAVYVRSRAIFEQVHACDVMLGYTPAIGLAAPPEQVLALVIKWSDMERASRNAAIDARQAQLAGLDDVQCAARFALLNQLYAQNPQLAAVMQQKTAIAGNKAVAARPNLPQDRVVEEVRRAAQERGSRIKGQNDIYPLVQEANACETRYGMGLTTLGQ